VKELLEEVGARKKGGMILVASIQSCNFLSIYHSERLSCRIIKRVKAKQGILMTPQRGRLVHATRANACNYEA
jgi:hypothetical protein